MKLLPPAAFVSITLALGVFVAGPVAAQFERRARAPIPARERSIDRQPFHAPHPPPPFDRRPPLPPLIGVIEHAEPRFAPRVDLRARPRPPHPPLGRFAPARDPRTFEHERFPRRAPDSRSLPSERSK